MEEETGEEGKNGEQWEVGERQKELVKEEEKKEKGQGPGGGRRGREVREGIKRGEQES